MSSWIKISLTCLVAGYSGLTYAQDSTAIGVANDTAKVDESLDWVGDDQLAASLDSMWMLWQNDHDDFTLEREKLNIYGFAVDSIPAYSDSVYAARFDEMNENSPFDFRYNDATKSYVSLYLKRRRKYTSKLLGLSEMYYPMFEEMLDKYDMPLELKHLAIVESGLNPRAKSRVGATGLWQFMYPTGKMLGLQVTSYVDERMDPLQATEAACQYLRYLHSMYNDWDLALAAYNAGPGNVNKAIRRAGGGKKGYWEVRPFLPKETRGYVPAFYAVNYMMTFPTEHNIYPRRPDIKYFETDTVHISEGVTFEQVAEVLCIKPDMVATMNPMYKEGIIPNPASGPKNVLRLPKDKVGLFLMNEVYVYNYTKKAAPQDGEIIETVRHVHTVSEGEYISSIARRYKCSVEELRIWNNLRSTKIHPGQKLVFFTKKDVPLEEPEKITSTKPTNNNSSAPDNYTVDPNSTFIYHTVQKGDTLWDIAKSNGTTVERIRRLNKNLDAKSLHSGQKIKIGVKG